MTEQSVGSLRWLLLLCSVSVAMGTSCGRETTALSHEPILGIEGTSQLESPTDIAVWKVIGSSVNGRPLRQLTLGRGTRKVLFLGGIHGDEPEGAYTTSKLPSTFVASGLGDKVTLTILEDANPDGRAAISRFNANGVDLNRNFPSRNFDTADPLHGGSPLSQPESLVVHDLVQQVDPDLVVVMHSWDGREFVNFDGPARTVAEQFSATSGLPLAESGSFAPTPGSLGSYVGRDLGTPLLTIELRKASDPVAGWESIREALLQAFRG
jgi:protein MpaA